MAAVDDGPSSARRPCLTVITRVSRTPAGATQPAAGLDHQRHAEALADTLDQRAVGLDIGRCLVPVADAEPAARD